MSSIYKHLSKVDLNVEKDHPALLPTEKSPFPNAPKLKVIKAGIIGAFALSMVAFVLIGLLFLSLKKEKAERSMIEKHYAAFKQDATTIKTEASQYRSELSRVQQQLKNYASERNVLKRELSQSKVEITNLRKQMKEIENVNQQLEAKTLQLSQRASTANVNVAPAGLSLDQASLGVSFQGPPISNVMTPPAFSAAGEEASSAVAEGAEAGAAAVAKIARVMTVNRKFNFVVVNLGLRDEMKIGDRLAVDANGRYVGTVQIEKLYDHFAAATIVEESKDAGIQEGLLIRRV